MEKEKTKPVLFGADIVKAVLEKRAATVRRKTPDKVLDRMSYHAGDIL